LRDLYTQESARIQHGFDTTSDGIRAIEARSALIDSLILDLGREFLAGEPLAQQSEKRAVIAAQNSSETAKNQLQTENFCIVALGGYGRRSLFPFSDVDLLFLAEDGATEKRFQEGTRSLTRALWDLRLKVGATNRVLAECEKFQRDNAEFNISLLD